LRIQSVADLMEPGPQTSHLIGKIDQSADNDKKRNSGCK